MPHARASWPGVQPFFSASFSRAEGQKDGGKDGRGGSRIDRARRASQREWSGKEDVADVIGGRVKTTISSTRKKRRRKRLRTVNELHVVLPDVFVEPREHAVTARVAFALDVLVFLEARGEDALSERRIGEDFDAEFLAGIDDAGALREVEGGEVV
jgi:hypothetical protein